MKNLNLNEALIDIIIAIYLFAVLFIFSYAVFVLHHSGWWFLFMLILLPNIKYNRGE